MNRKVLVSAVAAVVLGLSIVPGSSDLCKGFVPPNDMLIAVDSPEAKGVNEKQYNDVMDQIQAAYGPIVAARGGKLVINRRWSDATVNASAERQGSNYILNMYGGLARHESVTQDGLALVACHEMGHHLGGAPQYPNRGWGASNEGQSDYFASLKCAHHIFASPGAASFTRIEGDKEQALASCAKVYAKPADQTLCVRSSMAGMSLTSLLRVLRRETGPLPRFDTPDPKAVAKTSDSHPATQCRLDTYFTGALCSRSAADPLDDRNPAIGTCTRSQGYTVGLRPLCWYKPPVGEPNGLVQRSAPKAPALAATLAQTDLWKGF